MYVPPWVGNSANRVRRNPRWPDAGVSTACNPGRPGLSFAEAKSFASHYMSRHCHSRRPCQWPLHTADAHAPENRCFSFRACRSPLALVCQGGYSRCLYSVDSIVGIPQIFRLVLSRHFFGTGHIVAETGKIVHTVEREKAPNFSYKYVLNSRSIMNCLFDPDFPLFLNGSPACPEIGRAGLFTVPQSLSTAVLRAGKRVRMTDVSQLFASGDSMGRASGCSSRNPRRVLSAAFPLLDSFR